MVTGRLQAGNSPNPLQEVAIKVIMIRRNVATRAGSAQKLWSKIVQGVMNQIFKSIGCGYFPVKWVES